jgi:hypothetical protein
MAAQRMKVFKVLVQDSDNCIELARYINKNIKSINKLGIEIRMEKIEKDEFDDDMVEALRKRGITRLPAMVTNDGKTHVGLKVIIDMFEKGINNQSNASRVSPEMDLSSEMGSNPDMNNFWMRELYAGQDNKGRPIPKKDEDEEIGEKNDIERRLRDYDKNQPVHRRQADTREPAFDRDVENQQRRRRGNGRPPPPAYPEDNIDDDDEYDDGGYDGPPARRGSDDIMSSAASTMGEDAMDDKMMSAWMQNNPAGDY